MNATILRRHWVPLACLIVLPLLANALVLSGWLRNDPALFTAFLTGSMSGRPILAAPGWFDPTIGLITQPLGMLSAKDWLAGIVPWWNPYSGVGMPLAAEMQTMSFFLPFVLILKAWPGWLMLKLLMQILCGWFTYALLIELGTTRLAALIAGSLYALNATFFLVPHVMGTLPWAPLLLLGIERAHRAARTGQSRGWGLIPLALAYSIYGGYPEVAYINGTLAAAWTLWRLATLNEHRVRFAIKIALGVVIGLALTLPLSVPFLAYVDRSYLGTHATKYAWLWLLSQGAPVQWFPFIYGPIGAPTPATLAPGLANLITAYWDQSAGWFGPAATLAALAALMRPTLAQPARARRAHTYRLAWLLFGFILVWQARIWGIRPAIWLIDLIPLMAKTDAMRFCGPAMELACFIMAGIAVDSWQRSGLLDRRQIGIVAGIGTAIALVSLGAASPALIAWFRAAPGRLDFALTTTLAEIALAALALTLLGQKPSRRRAAVLAVLLLADPLGAATLTTLGAPRHARLDTGGVAFLQNHLGLARFYSLQPFGPNYPAAFRLASIDDNASPVSQAWSDYIHRHLDPYADVTLFTGSQARHLGCVLLPAAETALRHGIFIRPTRFIIPPDQPTELRRRLAAYAAIGVKYVLAPPDQDPFRKTAALPVNVAARIPFALGAGAALAGFVPAFLLPIHTIDSVGVLIGTYNGASRGPLQVKLCAGSQCATGSADLATARDNQTLTLHLDHKLTVPANASLHYTLSHASGAAVAIWLGQLDPGAPASLAVTGGAGHAPVLDFGFRPAAAPTAPVYADAVMRIYQLAHPAPLFSARPACTLTPRGLNAITTDCPAPSRLTRLEADDPGWRVHINGNATPITKTDEIFQSIALPEGMSHVRFAYRPPVSRISCAAALAALAAWIGLMAWPALRRK